MNDAWTHILKEVGFRGQDELVVTATAMKSCKESWRGPKNQFEPRLLAYQSSAANRPEIFKTNGLFILPIKNGSYLLHKFNLYKSLDYSVVPIVDLQKDKSSVILSIGQSETSLIDNLRYSGAFDKILGEPITHGPLLNGRHRCSIDFLMGGKTVSISGVQFETDSCFESANKILIIEGKSSSVAIDSFNIRQLYFPFREVKKCSLGKEVICLFVHELAGISHVWTYRFADIMRIDSIEITGHYAYRFI